MNRENVEAFCRIYCDVALKQGLSWDEINADLQTHMALRDEVRRIATGIADRGVLVVPTLTDGQCDAAITEAVIGPDGVMPERVSHHWLRRTLEDIAKGNI